MILSLNIFRPVYQFVYKWQVNQVTFVAGRIRSEERQSLPLQGWRHGWSVRMATTVQVLDTRKGRFAHKSALITGASDHGIGGAIASRLANEGAAIVLAS